LEKPTGELGQLPKSDRNAELQRRSIAVFQASLPADQFVFRDERSDDAGVDGSLELLIDSSQTNLRSQVQLKSTDSQKTNSDGSVSVPVKVSNLNYLLNGPSPLYVLHIARSNEIRFVWARDERKRLDIVNPAWEQQESVSIRFESVLSPETIQEIHQRIRKEAQFQREVNNILDAATSTEPLVVGISPDTLNVTDPVESKRILLRSGTAIASAGYIEEVRNLIRLLSPKDAREPRLLLVRAFVEHILGRYHEVSAILKDISLRSNELSKDDQHIHRMLKDICEVQTGIIDIQEFTRRTEKQLEDGDTRFALSNRLTRLRYAVLTERNLDRRVALLQELGILVTDILNDSDSSDGFKVHARLNLLEARGYLLALTATSEIGEARLKLSLGIKTDLIGMLTEHTKQFQEWEQESTSVLRDAIAQGNPIFIASTLVVRGNISLTFLTNQRVLRLMFDMPDLVFSEDAIQGIVESAKQAIEIFSQSGNIEGELRAKMLIADSKELIGDYDEAKAIALDVLPNAQAMEYVSLISRAQEHLAEQGLQNRIRNSHRPTSEEEQVQSSAQMSDEEIGQNATRMLKVLNLPTERLPILEREYHSFRDIADEKINWCKYIELLADKRHELHPLTHYKTDPARRCVCKLHEYLSTFENPDWKAVIQAFKRAYCDQCPDRSPLNMN
jgi:Domain of unknown function (DUF4365)